MAELVAHDSWGNRILVTLWYEFVWAYNYSDQVRARQAAERDALAFSSITATGGISMHPILKLKGKPYPNVCLVMMGHYCVCGEACCVCGRWRG